MRFLATCLIASFLVGQTSSVHAIDDLRLPRFQDVLYDIKAFTSRAKSASTDQEKTDALIDLSSLYLQVISDPRFARSETLQGYRGRLAGRLRTEQKALKRATRDKSSDVSRHSTDSVTDDQLFSAVIDDHVRLTSHAFGGVGPAMYFSSGMFGTSGYYQQGRYGGIMDDNADELIDLIETVLHPDFWQAAGGVGTLYYYRPSMILVVRATTTVHEDLTDLLERLR